VKLAALRFRSISASGNRVTVVTCWTNAGSADVFDSFLGRSMFGRPALFGRTEADATIAPRRPSAVLACSGVEIVEDHRWLPSFVLPRDPAVLKVIGSAQRYLRTHRRRARRAPVPPSAGFANGLFSGAARRRFGGAGARAGEHPQFSHQLGAPRSKGWAIRRDASRPDKTHALASIQELRL
jgi:hypothetical protein